MMIMKKILLVEDDKSLSNGICLALAASDIEIEQVFDLNLAWSMYSSNEYALIILDINLPDGNGLGFLKSIRKNSNCPVIILTADRKSVV